MDQRDGTRIPTDLHAVVACPQFGLFRGAVENIGPNGLFVRTRNVNICLNAPVTVTLQDDHDPENFCEASGVVVHQRWDGFGVRLDRMDDRCRALLESQLTNTGSPKQERRLAG